MTVMAHPDDAELWAGGICPGASVPVPGPPSSLREIPVRLGTLYVMARRAERLPTEEATARAVRRKALPHTAGQHAFLRHTRHTATALPMTRAW